jgi:hypothetical protein
MKTGDKINSSKFILYEKGKVIKKIGQKITRKVISGKKRNTLS